MINRRVFLQSSLLAMANSQVFAALKQNKLEAAEAVLTEATKSGLITSACLFVQQRDKAFQQKFGAAKSVDDIYLLASITKPICITAVMKLYDQGEFNLDDAAVKFLPEFIGDGREKITIRQLMTHVSGLPDQLPENAQLRSSHAPLSEFVKGAMRTPLLFPPGTKYNYSSMAILLATEIGMRISGKPIEELVQQNVFDPLGMRHSALGQGEFPLESLTPVQVEHAAPESGAGDPSTKEWDWNSPYWRKLGAPWGTAHGSAADVGRFLDEFLHPSDRAVKPETAKIMISNQNPPGIHPRGIGFDLGEQCGGDGCSSQTFGHGGSTGTLCWADPATETICVVLTTLPGSAVTPHPREIVSDLVAEAAG